MTVKGVVSGKSIELSETLPFPDGQQVMVTVEATGPADDDRPGSPQTILKILRQPPHLTKGL